MNATKITECPTCGKGNVRERRGANGGTYLCNVEVYPNGAAYPRGAHTQEACAAYKAQREANDAKWHAQDLRNSIIASVDAAQIDDFFDRVVDEMKAAGASIDEIRAQHPVALAFIAAGLDQNGFAL